MNDKSLAGQPDFLSRRRELWVCFLLVLATVAVYWPVGNFEFINIDDFAYVTENAHVQRGISLENIQWAFQTRYAGNWHPLTTLSHMLDCQLFSLNSGAHHLTNLFFHLLNTLLLFALLQRLTGAFWKSAIVAALFALHPLHVESVAWVSERKDVLSGFFFLLTLWAYARYVGEQGRKGEKETGADSHFPAFSFTRSLTYYSLALIFFTLGLLSKPMLVTLPFVLMLLDYWPLKRISHFTFHTSRPLLLEKIPFFALAAASSVATFYAQKGGGAVVALEHYPLIPRLTNALVSYIRYLGKTFYPKSLAVFYPYEGGWDFWQPIAAIILLAAISGAAIWFARRAGYFFVGWFWFLGMLVPVIGLVQVGSQSMADRYTYLPHIGLFIAVVWLVADRAPDCHRLLLSRYQKPTANRRSGLLSFPGACAMGVGLLLVGCVIVSSVQVRHWRNTKTLLKHAVAVTTGNAPAHYYLGYVFETFGATDEALSQYVQAIRISPGFVDAHCNIGNIYSRQNRTDEALAAYASALQVKADFSPAHYGLAELLSRLEKNVEAKNHYEAAIRARPGFAEAHYQLAVLLEKEKQTARAIQHYNEAIGLKPDWLEALNNLAWLLATSPDETLRDGKSAADFAKRACALTDYKNPGALDTLAAAHAEAGEFSDAIQTAKTAAELADDSSKALADEIRSRLQLYRAGKAYRDSE